MPARSRTPRSNVNIFAGNCSTHHSGRDFTPFSPVDIQGMLAGAVLRTEHAGWDEQVYGVSVATEANSRDINSLLGPVSTYLSFINTCAVAPTVPLLDVESETDGIINRLSQTTRLEDEEEPAPAPAVVEEATCLIREAGRLMRTFMREGTVSTFYGEINVTWRNGSHIVRLACFPLSPGILQFGNLAQPLGSYQSQQSPSAQDLAARLDALNGEMP